jgi:hypothetical protein
MSVGDMKWDAAPGDPGASQAPSRGREPSSVVGWLWEIERRRAAGVIEPTLGCLRTLLGHRRRELRYLTVLTHNAEGLLEGRANAPEAERDAETDALLASLQDGQMLAALEAEVAELGLEVQLLEAAQRHGEALAGNPLWTEAPERSRFASRTRG